MGTAGLSLRQLCISGTAWHPLASHVEVHVCGGRNASSTGLASVRLLVCLQAAAGHAREFPGLSAKGLVQVIRI